MRISRMAGLLAAAMTVTSCGRLVESTMSGAWELEAVNGDLIPIVLPPAPEPRIIREGVLLIFPDGSYTYDHWIELSEGPSVRMAGASAGGSWERDGDDIRLTDWATGKTSFGTAYGTTLRVISGRTSTISGW
ncbi:MAG TPA: hypothetical protein VFX40_02000 [Gemmatimonadaceae bacterium]|nr:hypothetical protein [Gemmatimonadaceae bacterium]